MCRNVLKQKKIRRLAGYKPVHMGKQLRKLTETTMKFIDNIIHVIYLNFRRYDFWICQRIAVFLYD